MAHGAPGEPGADGTRTKIVTVAELTLMKERRDALLTALKNAHARLGSIMDAGVGSTVFELAITGQDDAKATIEAAEKEDINSD